LLLSNAPRRAYALVEAMTRMGLERELYGEVLSSGEATRDALIARTDPFFAGLAGRAYHLGPERDRSVFDGTGVEIAASIDGAGYIVNNTGPTELHETIVDYDDVLAGRRQTQAAHGLRQSGHRRPAGGQTIVCAGAYAQRYLAMGGLCGLSGQARSGDLQSRTGPS